MRPQDNAPMRMGVNYTPSSHWFYSWLHPEWDAVHRDMDDIIGLEADHVRILPLWPLLQPNRTWIDPRSLEDLRRTCEIAGERGLDVSVDVFQGHLSGFDFVPSWLLSWHERSPLTDPDVIRAQHELVTRVEAALADLPNYAGLTLGNEFNQFVSTAHPGGMTATPQDVDRWLDALLDCDARPEYAGRGGEAPFRLHAENDMIWFDDAHPFLPRHATTAGEATTIHSWVFNGTAQGYGPLSFEATHLAAYLIELARAFAPNRMRPVWVQEIGAPLSVMTEQESEEFLVRSVRAIAERPGVPAITWWCSHDVDRSLADFPDLEYSLGLIDQDHRTKPQGERFRECARALRAEPARAVGEDLDAPTIVVGVDEQGDPLERRELSPGGGVFEAWMAACRDDPHVRILTSADAAVLDPARDAMTVVPCPTGRSYYSSVSDSDYFSTDVAPITADSPA